MTKTTICKLTLCVLFLSPLAPMVAAKAQNMGTDPQPINPHVASPNPPTISPGVISVLVSVALGIA